MRVLHICYSDLNGGAARAAFRLHRAQRKAGMDSRMLVIEKESDDPCVHTVSGAKKIRIKLAAKFARLLLKLQKSPNQVFHSLNLFRSGLLKQVNSISPDVVNLHWVGDEMLSIGEISRIRQPTVWTLHDMWAFSGCEHYDDNEGSERYKCAYSKASKNTLHKRLDLDRFVNKYKRWRWKRKTFHLVTPSRWMGECARASSLFKEQQVSVIPNCIDHEAYRPIEKGVARDILQLPKEKKLLLFGAMSSTSDSRKGYHLLVDALKQLKQKNAAADEFALVIFGASQGSVSEDTGLETIYFGRLHDDVVMNLLYSAADVFMAPSLQDNLPNTLVESLACGTPCIAFRIGGMADLITEDSTGILVDEVSGRALCEGLLSMFESSRRTAVRSGLSRSLRGEHEVSEQYSKLYVSCLQGS